MSEESTNKDALQEQEAESKETKKKGKKKGKKSKESAKEELAQQQLLLQECQDKQLRLLAEFDNFRRRNAKANLELQANAAQSLITELLPVLDDMNRAKVSMEGSEDVKSIKEGLTLIQNKMFNLLESKGLKAMESMGKEFDPEWHEALTEIPAADKDQIGKVVDVVENGYLLNDKILRYAKVVVGK